MSEGRERRYVFRGRVVELSVDTVVLPNGRAVELEIVHHPGGAAVVAINEHHEVCLLRQYRHAAGGWLWELPAGRLEPGEPPLLTAQRELEEEAGLRAADWEPLGKLVSSPGVFTEVIHLFLAHGLQHVVAKAEEHELFEVHWHPFRDALDRARHGEIQDGKTVTGLFRAEARLAEVSAPLPPRMV